MTGMGNHTAEPVHADQSELVIALVAAVGTDIGLICDQVATQLDGYAYSHQVLRLSDYLAENAQTDFRGYPFRGSQARSGVGTG
jgi:hypothetical protein